jgi:acetylornithine/N-succinyldiaminopimelate aminotransferase
VQTGMARTGTFYASEAAGLTPDLITLAKPLSGGLPLSAVLIPEKVNSLIQQGDHGTTFGGGPVTTAVAARVWEIMSAPGFIAHVREMGELLQQGLRRLRDAFPSAVGELRGTGLLRGFEYTGGEVKDFLDALRARGMLALRSGANVVRFAPPLIITGREIETGIRLIEEALR